MLCWSVACLKGKDNFKWIEIMISLLVMSYFSIKSQWLCMDKFRVFACILMMDVRIKTKDSVCLYTSQFSDLFSVEKVSHYTRVNTVNIFIFCILVFSQGSKLLVSFTFYVCFKTANNRKNSFLCRHFFRLWEQCLLSSNAIAKEKNYYLAEQYFSYHLF